MTAGAMENPGEAQARRLESVSEQLTTLLRQPEVVRRLRATLGENEWSTMQVLGHLVEMIPYWLSSCRALIASTAGSPAFGRTLESPERLAGPERGAAGDADELLRRLNEEVQAAVRAIRQMSSVERGKKGVHVRRGEMTVAEVVDFFVIVHAEEHLAQVKATLQI